MSVRLCKIMIIVTALHLGVLTLIWVGFVVPAPRASADFVYVQSSNINESGDTGLSTFRSEDNNIDLNKKSVLAPWSNLRELKKPKL